MTLPATIRDVVTVARYELRMQLRRPALWLTTVLVFGFITYRLVDSGGKGGPPPAGGEPADATRPPGLEVAKEDVEDAIDAVAVDSRGHLARAGDGQVVGDVEIPGRTRVFIRTGER